MPPKKAPVRTKARDSDIVEDDFVKNLDGVEVRLPSLSYLDTGVLRQIRDMDFTGQTFAVIEMHLEGEALAAVDKLKNGPFAEFLEEWRVHSGISLGES